MTDCFERELIKPALRGEEEAGREILLMIALAIDAGRFDSPLFPFLADCLCRSEPVPVTFGFGLPPRPTRSLSPTGSSALAI
jgi:hypothetical protein